jgi:hypothetical protein
MLQMEVNFTLFGHTFFLNEEFTLYVSNEIKNKYEEIFAIRNILLKNE